MVRKSSRILSAVGSLILLASCGSPDLMTPRSSSTSEATDERDASADIEETSADATAGHVDHLVEPPQEYYDAILKDTMRNMDDPDQFSLAGDPQVLFVNFNGANIQKGFGKGQSFILCQQSATVPPSGLSAADMDDIMNMVQQFYDNAGAKLVVTGQEPSSGDYSIIHVGGSYSDLGCFGSGVLGVAPYDVGNINRNDVGFAFSKGVFSNQVIAETIAHEAGHSFGLDHINNNAAIMYYASSPNITGFGSGTVRGSFSTQDSPKMLQEVLGPYDGTSNPIALPNPMPPSTTPTTPTVPTTPNAPGGGLAGLPGLDEIAAIGDLLPDLLGGGANLDLSAIEPLLEGLVGTGIGLDGLDQILAAIGLASNAGQNGGNSGSALPIDLSAAQDILGGLLGGGLGGLTGLIGQAGFGDLGQAFGSLQDLFGGLGSGVGLPSSGSAGNAISQLPDLSELLGIMDQCNDPASVLSGLIGSTRVVNANYTGDQREALLSMLKVAYAQAYQKAQAPTN